MDTSANPYPAGIQKGIAALTGKKIKVALEMAGAKPAQGTEYFSDEHIALIENEIGNSIPSASGANLDPMSDLSRVAVSGHEAGKVRPGNSHILGW